MINQVIDISHYTKGDLDFKQARYSGIIGVIHKASEGLGKIDDRYAFNRPKAQAEGLLWGAYHFADGSDATAQADYFLRSVGDRTGVLLTLDLEEPKHGPPMSLDGAHTFVSRIHEVTGVWPGLYCGSYAKQLLAGRSDPLLAKCWLWLAEYGPTPVVPPTWPTWTMWQYTDGSAGPEPHAVPGIGNCLRDKFNGDESHLRALWKG